MPKISDIEQTPNPNARKFSLAEPLSWGIAHSYANLAAAKGDKLAEALLTIEHVTNVFYVDNWLTVTQDGLADWNELLRQIAVPLRSSPAASAESALLRQGLAQNHSQDLSHEQQVRLDAINQLLDQQVRPFLQSDGGDLFVVALEGNLLKVHYQGACGSCPSSLSGTLAGVLNLIHMLDPEIEISAV